MTLRHLHQDVQTSESPRASFNLPPVTFDRAGPYHCQYQKYVSDQLFISSPSVSVTLHGKIYYIYLYLCTMKEKD